MKQGTLKENFLRWIFRRYFLWRLPDVAHIKDLADAIVRIGPDTPYYPILLDYAPTLESRYGEGKPPIAALVDLFAASVPAITTTLRALQNYRDELLRISEAPPINSAGPYWANDWLTGFDAIALYGMLALHSPAHYLEVGSGNSTKFARQVIRDKHLATRIISIDPHPRAEIDSLCDVVIRSKLEEVDVSHFDVLEAGDILFIDNSHRVFQGSDVTVFFLEVLPRLRPGVLVQIHDIFLPFDYPMIWRNRHYSEQYMLASYLLAGGGKLDILLPVPYAENHPTLGKEINDFWTDSVFQRSFALNRGLTSYIGTSSWFVTT